MKKIPTIFKRDPNNMKLVTILHNPDCLWVFFGEGIATRKYDGTCVKVENGKYFKRREVKKGKEPPKGFIEEMEDPNTGKKVGWVPVTDSNEDKYHIEAYSGRVFKDGTYELCGPKIQGNPEKYDRHLLVKHSSAEQYPDCPRNYNDLKLWLKKMDIEGVVFHHPDGRMAKIKKRDFGLER